MNLLSRYSKIWLLPIVAACIPFVAYCAQVEPLYPLVIHAKKEAHLFQVELADTPEAMAKGLMNRETLPPDHGMLFKFATEDKVSFWMRNTLVPLDMLFIKKGGRIAHIHAMAKPLDETAIPSTVPVIAVLEIAGGQAAKRGISTGDTLETILLQETKNDHSP